MAATPPRTPAERRRRARRGSIERPVSGRIYRAAWALVALPLLIAAFTIARPAALPPPALPPSFDGPTAAQIAQDLADDCPDRTPGTDGAACATDWVRDRLDDYELAVEEQAFEADVPGRGPVRFVNLVARPATDSEAAGPPPLTPPRRQKPSQYSNGPFGSGTKNHRSNTTNVITGTLIEISRTIGHA